MVRHLSALLLIAIWAAHAAAGIKLEGDTKVEPYKLVRLEVTGAPDTAAVIFDFDEEKLDVEQQGRRVVFTGPPGAYKIKATAITLSKDGQTLVEVARVTVTIGKAPAPPGPDPGPRPPDPPAPLPDDPLTASVRAAWAKETGLARKSQMQFLASVYAGSGAIVDAPDTKTTGDLYDRLSMAIHAQGVGIPKGSLPHVSRAVGERLATDLGNSAATQLDKARARASLAAVAESLAKVAITLKEGD